MCDCVQEANKTLAPHNTEIAEEVLKYYASLGGPFADAAVELLKKLEASQ